MPTSRRVFREKLRRSAVCPEMVACLWTPLLWDARADHLESCAASQDMFLHFRINHWKESHYCELVSKYFDTTKANVLFFLTTLVKQPWTEMQPRGIKSLGIPLRRQNIIKMDTTETGWNLMHWIIWLGIQDSDLFSWNRSWALGFHKTWTEFLGYIKTITFPRKHCSMDLWTTL